MMNITLFDFPIFPAFVYCITLSLIVFLISLRVKTEMKKRIFVTFSLAGFIGFCLTFVLPLYKFFYHSYFLVPITFFIEAVIGIIGCLILNINPFDPTSRLFAPKEKKNKPKSSILLHNDPEEDKPFVQTLSQSEKLIDLLLFKMGAPYTVMKKAQFKNNNETIEFPFLLLGPNGLFALYPCNWSGPIAFTNNGANKIEDTPEDCPDYSVVGVFRENLLKRMLDTIGIQSAPLKTIICVTNPSASIQETASKYDAVELGDLAQHIRNLHLSEKTLTPANLFDIKNAIDINNTKK